MHAVLLVEDDLIKGNALGRMLLAEGVTTIRVDTLYDAFKALREEATSQHIKAVMTDWTFPMRAEEDPRELSGARMVRECEERSLPVVVVSGREGGAPADFKNTPWIRFEPSVDIRGEIRAWVKQVREKVPGL